VASGTLSDGNGAHEASGKAIASKSISDMICFFIVFSSISINENKKVRLPKQTHKNASSDSRQVNPCKTSIISHKQRELAFYQILFLLMTKKDILLPKRKLYPFCGIRLV
jgi:hypothetical protein